MPIAIIIGLTCMAVVTAIRVIIFQTSLERALFACLLTVFFGFFAYLLFTMYGTATENLMLKGALVGDVANSPKE
ncbi:hypothetical protein ACLPHM_02715 [Paenalcaligenes sp. Me131]|uniref:hypothetical protein n=1 Tax=Paenalcaligenes sp. Me131 TaxID=3392636 RepID=UPI003D28A2BA